MTRLAILFLAACAGAPDGLDTAPPVEVPTEGTASFRFAIDEDYAAAMSEPPTGIFYGGIFHEADVTAVGVEDEGLSIEDFAVDLALTLDGAFTEPAHTSGPLPIGKLYVLGYLDSDVNGPGTGPDQGDAVTKPGTDHRIEILGGQDILADVVLDLLMP
ncbi:MAG: hypothetical protein Q8P18_11420 [Pseudomonadota bacterium]|nr:hypothetical protein [Pseudomonadota bacterium]